MDRRITSSSHFEDNSSYSSCESYHSSRVISYGENDTNSYIARSIRKYRMKTPALSTVLSSLNKSDPVTVNNSHFDDFIKTFPPPLKRPCPVQELPVYKNGQCIPRKDALLVEMILNKKANLQAQLEITKSAVVGLEFLTEYIHPKGDAPRVYHCSLCKTFRTVASVMEHITSYNHRVNYIAKQFPSEVKTFLMPDGRNKNRNKGLMQIAAKRCSELELVYGRGVYDVSYEKPIIPEGNLDGPENYCMIEQSDQTKFLQDVLQKLSKIKIENSEEERIAKSITSVLTNAVCEFKYLNYN